MIFAGIASLLSVSVCLFFLLCADFYDHINQAVQGVSAGQDAIFNLFDRIETFFRRLEAYVELPLTVGMTDIIVKVMAEVLLILSLAAKDIRRGKISVLMPDNRVFLSTYHFQRGFLRIYWDGRTSRTRYGGWTCLRKKSTDLQLHRI